jgi:hypothetical protein
VESVGVVKNKRKSYNNDDIGQDWNFDEKPPPEKSCIKKDATGLTTCVDRLCGENVVLSIPWFGEWSVESREWIRKNGTSRTADSRFKWKKTSQGLP